MPVLQPVDVLAFGAHPDDVELGCGGTLYKLTQAGHRVAIADLTEGEMGSRGTVADRYREAEAAAQILGVSQRVNLKIPDTRIELNAENREKVIRLVRELQPKLVFAPYPDDRHPDHIHASHLVREACFYAGLKKVLPELPLHRPERVIYYPCTYQFQPAFVVDISAEFSVKMEAIRAYRSQFYNPDWQGAPTFISTEEFLKSVEVRARHYGWQAGVTYAEPFWMREPLVLPDIMALLG